MKNIQLLDCTLRDGGYLNDWEFDNHNLTSIFERITDARVDIIEVGFLDERRPFDINRSIMPDTKSVEEIWGGISKKPPMVVAMIDYGTCNIENLQPCSESYLDGIRVIFKEHKMYEAMEFCAKVKKLGYKVFSQLVSITSYTDEKLLEVINLVNQVEPYAISMVDTYGLLHPEDLIHYYKVLDEHVKENIHIGFHAHNNLQLAYANSLAFLEYESKHNIIVDGTLYGMGKSAGNAPIELLAMRLNEKYDKNYDINSMLEGIRESIMEFQVKFSWGYKLFFYLCALNKCHPNYVSYFENKQNLSISKLDDLLSMIHPEDKKLLYDKLTAEKVYNDYMEEYGNDSEDKKRLFDELKEKSILLIGPGKNIALQEHKIEEFVKNEQPCVISVNYIPKKINVNYVFVTNTKRYSNIKIDKEKVIATSNVECRGGKFDFVINRASLIERDAKIIDNSFLMLLRLLNEIGIQKVVCAGFDGYSEKEDNYFNPTMEYGFVKKEAHGLNRHMRNSILELRKGMKIEFLTYSSYDEEDDVHGAAF